MTLIAGFGLVAVPELMTLITGFGLVAGAIAYDVDYKV